MFPTADLEILAKVSVVYVTLPGWNTQISSITSFDDLPDNCKRYVGFIENFLGVPIEWIGIGPGRESMLKKTGILMSN
jgi:adenylosuccinate synthase